MTTPIGTTEPTATPPRHLRRYLLATLLLLLALALAAALSLATLDANWLKQQLQQKALSSLDAQLQIDAVTFSKWKGYAALSGVHLHRDNPDDNLPDETLTVACRTAEIEVALLPLIFRSVHVKRLELTAPDVTIAATRPAEDEAATTIDKFKKWIRPADKKTLRPIPRDEPVAGKDLDWRIDRLLIHEGRFDYTLTRPDRPDFRATATHIDYAARDVSVKSLPNLLVGADVTADLDLGGPARLVKRGTADPATFTLTGVNLGYADRLLNQSDALVLSSGTMDIVSSHGPQQPFRFDVKLTNLQLDENPNVPSGEFLLIPVKRLSERAKSQGNSMTLTFDLNSGKTLNDDFSFVVNHFTAGLLEAIAKELVRRHPTTGPAVR